MAEIDFITAFGRLLQDGQLRDAFAADPLAAAEQIRLRAADRFAWRQLNPAEVELQAKVLLDKRLDLVKFFAPETCRRLGGKARLYFYQFGRHAWPPLGSPKSWDAFLFCQQLRPTSVVNSEWNRLKFAFSSCRFALHWAEIPGNHGQPRSGIQILLRGHGQSWREFLIYAGW